MPWKRYGKCVHKLNADGSKGEQVSCHDTEEQADRKMRALYASEEKEAPKRVEIGDMPDSVKEQEKSYLDRIRAYIDYLKGSVEEEVEEEESKESGGSLMFTKDSDGRWWWVGVVTNNRMDKDEEILTADAHRYFEQALDNGTYKAVLGKEYPDTWFWHIPVPIAEAHVTAYDERGYLIAAGPQKEGEFYSALFQKMADYERKHPGSFAMSHGMPNFTLEYNKDDGRYIEKYLSTEFTILPRGREANEGTVAGAIRLTKGAMPMQVNDYKREQFAEIFGQDNLAEFDRLLSEMSEAADAAGIPKKEKKMTEVEKTAQEEEVKESPEPTAEQEVEETKAAAEDMEEEEAEEEEDMGKEYVTQTDLEEAMKQAAEGIGEGMAAIKAQIQSLQDTISETQKQLKELGVSEEERIAKKAQDTPKGSFSAIFAESIVGKDAAKIDYNDERTLYKSGPEETKGDAEEQTTGISSIDKLINKQQGRRRVVSGYASNGQ